MTTTARDTQFVVLLDDDVNITEGLAMGLEREGRTIVTCNDVESAELIIERFRPSHIVADIRISGPYGFEGLDLIKFAKRVTPESRVILISGDDAEPLQMEGSERGAVAFLHKPFETGELDRMLDLISCSELSHGGIDRPLIRMPLLDEIIASEDLKPFVQPIVQLDSTRKRIAFESLTRFRSDSPLRNPELLFRYAARKDRIGDLEIACMNASLKAAKSFAAGISVFINVHPQLFNSGSRLRDAILRDGIDPTRVVLEITEQGSLKDTPQLLKTIAELRELGIRFAYDDLGVAYSHLTMIDKVRPSFLKVSQDFGTGFETDPTKRTIVSNLRSLAVDFGCELILEGIEDLSTARAAQDLQIPLGQGFLFGRPADVADYFWDIPGLST